MTTKKYLSMLVLALSLSAPTYVSSASDDVVVLDSKTSRELRCLELNLHYEARGEPLEGIIAVANVTMNRVKSGLFPDSVCKVVFQPYQFSWVQEQTKYWSTRVSPKIQEIAYAFLIEKRHKDNTHGALYFHNRSVPDFNRRLTREIGQHRFYR